MLKRRSFTAGIGSGGVLAASLPATAESCLDLRMATPSPLSTDTPVFETSLGKIQGYRRNGIHVFKGVPYAASAAGAARFMPPAVHSGWKNIRGTRAYGPVCPQPPRWRNDDLAFLFDWNEGYAGEDCLHLNVWTPSPDNGRRPVMVWLHGGGFHAGSSYELPSYDGENLSHRGDVVVVSVNHRVGSSGTWI